MVVNDQMDTNDRLVNSDIIEQKDNFDLSLRPISLK